MTCYLFRAAIVLKHNMTDEEIKAFAAQLTPQLEEWMLEKVRAERKFVEETQQVTLALDGEPPLNYDPENPPTHE